MPRIPSFRSRGRPPIRAVVALGAVLFVIVNVASGLGRGQQVTPVAATDAQIETFLRQQIQDAGYPGASFAIVRDGRVTHAGGIGRADETGRAVRSDTPFVIGSLSKAITATAVMQLVERGWIDLDAPVTRYLPRFAVADGRASEITARHLLHHTSGIPTAAGTDPLSGDVTTIEDQTDALRHVVLASAPGSSFAYSNANYVVLGALVAEVSGAEFGDYLQGAVFAPLRMTGATTDLVEGRTNGLTRGHRFWFGMPRGGEPLWRPDLLPAGWLIASADDLGRFVAANLDGGELDGRRILSPGTIAEMHHGATGVMRGAYGMGWIEGRLGGSRIVSHSGSTTDMASAIYMAPDEGLGIVLLFNAQSVVYELLHKPEAIAEAAFAGMLGEPAGGTLAALYPVFTVAGAVLIAAQLRSLRRVALLARRGAPTIRPVLGRRSIGAIMATWGRLIGPVLVLAVTPSALGASWDVLLHLDVGQLLAAYAALQLLTGAVAVSPRVVASWRSRHAPHSGPLGQPVG